MVGEKEWEKSSVCNSWYFPFLTVWFVYLANGGWCTWASEWFVCSQVGFTVSDRKTKLNKERKNRRVLIVKIGIGFVEHFLRVLTLAWLGLPDYDLRSKLVKIWQMLQRQISQKKSEFELMINFHLVYKVLLVSVSILYSAKRIGVVWSWQQEYKLASWLAVAGYQMQGRVSELLRWDALSCVQPSWKAESQVAIQ